MSAAELKLEIFDKLSILNDENLLIQINDILKNASFEINSFKLNLKQIKMIEASENDYINGNLQGNESVFNDDKKWLESL